MTKRSSFLLLLLLGLPPHGSWAQQPSDQQKTADGVAACPADSASRLPDGVVRLERFDHPPAGLVPPKPLVAPVAKFSDEARKFAKKHHVKSFLSTVALTVDEEGNPRDVCVVEEAGHGLDRNAYDAVQRCRFQPGVLNGTPVAVRMHVEVNFKIY